MVPSKVPHKYDAGVDHTVIEGTTHNVWMVLNGHDVNWLGGVPDPGSPHATYTDAPPGQTEISDIFGDASTAPVFQLQVIGNPASQGGASNPSNTCTFESISIAQDLGDESESPDKEGDLREHGEHFMSSVLDYAYVMDCPWGDLAPPYVAQYETPPSRAWSTSSGTPDSVVSGEESKTLSDDSPRTDFSSTDSGSFSSASNAGSSTGDYSSDSSDSWSASTVVGRSTTPGRGDRQTKFRQNAVGAIVPPKEKGALEAAASEQEFLKQFFSVPIIQARLEENAAGRHPGRPGQPGSINSLLRRWLAVRGSKLAAAKAADEAVPYFDSANFGGRLPLLGSAALLQLAHDAKNPLVSVRVGTVILPHRALSF
jgi:hypothetical protein